MKLHYKPLYLHKTTLLRYLIILLFVFSLSLSAQVQKYTTGSVTLRDGTTLDGELKINSLATTILFKNGETGEKMKLTARELKFATVNEGVIRAKISFKILNGKGKGPKIVQHITEGSVSLYKKLDGDHDYYRPAKPKNTNPVVLNNTSNGNYPTTAQSGVMVGGLGGYALLYSLMVRSEKIWFYGKQDSDVVDILPKKRDDVMKLFNDCPQAMVKFRDVDDKEFDFVYFLNYYNVECAGN